jgi:hypothetical protein
MSDKKPSFSEKRIKEITLSLKKRVAEHVRKQNAGILPFFSRMPIVVIEIRHVMVIISRERGAAGIFMKKVREDLGKKPRQKVSVTEFCRVTTIPIEDVRQALNLLT